MSLNDIRLTPQLVADLYGHVLVELATKAPAHAGLKTLGGNEKHILIVVNHEGDAVLPDTERTFLSSILTACKLTLNDVVILNWNGMDKESYKDVLHQFESRFVLLFGVAPLSFGLPMDFPPFQIQPFGSHQYLYAPPLSKIQEHKGIKAELWQALKKLFML
jgi:DNA polymerase III psi subunit